MDLETSLPCYEVAENISEGEIIRLRAKTGEPGFSYVTLATKDEKFKGLFVPGKNYKLVITEVP